MPFRIFLLTLAYVIGCGKQLNAEFCATHADDSRCMAAMPDAPDAKVDVAHLAVAIEDMLTSTDTVTISMPTMINTTTGEITPPLTGATVLPSAPQESGGNVMVIQARNIAINAGLTVKGDKPLIVVGTRTISVTSPIDVSADLQINGPGGALAGLGMGSGQPGSANGSGDGGGGGASYGTDGGGGGDGSGGSRAEGGLKGVTYALAARLTGGSGGGRGSPSSCNPFGGAGGGAFQLTAGDSISIVGAGSIDAGGAGGKNGGQCSSLGGSGGGGGSGGMIFLQAPMLTGSGTLGANGGGGGAGASADGSSPGLAGMDATLTLGGGSGLGSSDGGAGASGTTAGVVGESDTSSDSRNGGGGGGGGGVIYYMTSGPQPTYVASPPARPAS